MGMKCMTRDILKGLEMCFHDFQKEGSNLLMFMSYSYHFEMLAILICISYLLVDPVTETKNTQMVADRITESYNSNLNSG